jgi:hypothetical protein
MKFLISVIDDQSGTADGDEMAAIDAFNDGLRNGGHFIIAVGISGPEHASTIDGRGTEVVTKPGPLHAINPQQEYISGFWLIEARDLEQAQALAAEGSRSCNRRVELRPLLG